LASEMLDDTTRALSSLWKEVFDNVTGRVADVSTDAPGGAIGGASFFSADVPNVIARGLLFSTGILAVLLSKRARSRPVSAAMVRK
jgi:hypothetical protein